MWGCQKSWKNWILSIASWENWDLPSGWDQILGFTKSKTVFEQSCIMIFSYGLKRSCVAQKFLKNYTVAQKCHGGYFEKVPIWHFWTTAWIFKLFVAKQLLFRPYEKVSIQSCPKSVSDSVKPKIWPHPEGKSQFSREAIDRIQFFQLFWHPHIS